MGVEIYLAFEHAVFMCLTHIPVSALYGKVFSIKKIGEYFSNKQDAVHLNVYWRADSACLNMQCALNEKKILECLIIHSANLVCIANLRKDTDPTIHTSE
jgi:hypothetical protein